MENRPTSESSVRKDPTLRWSIGAKLTIAFLALAIIPMSATAYYNLTQGQGEVAKVAGENLMELSRSTAHHIGQLLTENQRTSATLAGQPSVILFLAASGEERQALAPRVYQTLQNFADNHPDYDAPGLLDVNGIVVASLADILVGKDRSFRDYFQASIQGEPYVSDILVERATGRPGVFLTNPVVTAKGEIVGIDIVWLKGDTIWSIIDDVVVGEEGMAYLVDQDGVIVAHPNRDLLYHSLGELTPEAVATISATIRFGTIEGTDTPLIPESLDMDDLAAELVAPPQSPPIPGGKSGTYRYYSPLDHRDHVVGYTRLETHPWTVVVDLPEAQFLAPLQRLGSVAWGSVGVVGVMTLVVSILLVRGITRPIRRLTDAAIAVEHGQPFEPADIADVTSGRDEIAHLGRVFSGMVLALRRREERIEHLNLVLRAIRSVNQLITREKDRDRLLQGACDDLIETRGYYNAWIALLDEHRGLVTSAEAGLGEEFLPLVEQLKRGELTACGQRALRQSGVVAIADPPSTCADCPLADKCGGKGAMTVRLEYGGKVYGLMSVSIPADFIADEEEQALFKEVAEDIAFALHGIELEEARKRAEKALQQYAERLRTLRAIDGAILAAWSPEEVAQTALRHIRQLVPCQQANVMMFDREGQEATVLTAHTNGKTRVGTGARLPLEKIGLLEELRQGKVHVEEDVLALAQPSPMTQALQAEGLRSHLAVPLIVRGELIGVLALGAESPGAFAPDHVDIAREVADQIAVGLHQARLRAALEAEEQRLETLVKHLPEGVLLLDGERRILLANPVVESYLLVLTGAAGPSVSRVGNVLTYLADWPLEELVQSTPEGLWRELEVAGPPQRLFGVAAKPVRTETQIEGWVLLIWDVTHEREVERRTQQQERLAAVGQLAGGIAHDFNNLLTTIMLYAQMLLRKPHLPPDMAPSLETIINESRGATQLVQRILDFSRRSIMDTRPVDLISFTEGTVDILRRTLPENIRLFIEMRTGEYIVNADPTRIQQVLMNLAVNARDAMPEGGELRIGLSRVKVRPGEEPPVAEMPAGEWVCLAISDTGTGMSPEVVSHLYEPFFTTKPVGKGTGLGLAQVYGIVQQHDGHIGVETQVGRGTTFRIYLPAQRVVEAEEGLQEEALATPEGEGETILLVEDEEKVREGGQKILESLGYRVLTAADGREALEVYGAEVDLVITDMVMPEMGGRELVRQLRKANPHLKALAITGYALPEDVQELREEGILDIVQKPFEVSTLAEVIRRVLDAG